MEYTYLLRPSLFQSLVDYRSSWTRAGNCEYTEISMKIPILDLSTEIKSQWTELNDAIQKVLLSGRFIVGENVVAFEKETASYLGVKHAVGLNSGTDALVLGLRALGVGPGDEVITTSFTFFATSEAISLLGATPVFAEIDPITFNIDVAQIEKKITSRTKAILPVHLFGLSADMTPLLEIAKKHKLLVLEDVAQAFGGEHQGKKLGSLGDGGTFSFFPTKNLGAFGDGGLFVTNNDALAEKVRMLRVHGSKKRYHHEMLGYTSRLDELQAAILRVKLPRIDEYNRLRRQVAGRYREMLQGMSHVTLPSQAPEKSHVYHQFTVRITNGQRDEVHQKLAEMGIDTMIYYPIPVHRLEVYGNQFPPLPLTEKAATEVLSLPIWPDITSDIQFQVAKAIRSLIA